MGVPRSGATAGSAGPAAAERKAYDKNQESAAAAVAKPKQVYMSSAEFQKADVQAELAKQNAPAYTAEFSTFFSAFNELRSAFMLPSGLHLPDGPLKTWREKMKAINHLYSNVKKYERSDGMTVGYSPPPDAFLPFSDQIAPSLTSQLIADIQRQNQSDAAAAATPPAIPIPALLMDSERYATLSHTAKRDLYAKAKRIVQAYFFDTSSAVQTLEMYATSLKQGWGNEEDARAEVERINKTLQLQEEFEIFEDIDDKDLASWLEKPKAAKKDIQSLIVQCIQACEASQQIADVDKRRDSLRALYERFNHLESFHAFHAQAEFALAEFNKWAEQEARVFAPICQAKLEEIAKAIEGAKHNFTDEALAQFNRQKKQLLAVLSAIKKQSPSQALYEALLGIGIPTVNVATEIKNDTAFQSLGLIVNLKKPSKKEQLQEFNKAVEVPLVTYQKKADHLEKIVKELKELNDAAGNPNKLADVLKKIGEIKTAKSIADAQKALDAVYAMLKDKKYLDFGITHISQDAEGNPLIVADFAKERIELLRHAQDLLAEFKKDKQTEPLRLDFQKEMKKLLHGTYNDQIRKRMEAIYMHQGNPQLAKLKEKHHENYKGYRLLSVSTAKSEKKEDSDNGYYEELADRVLALNQFCKGNFSEHDLQSDAIKSCLQRLHDQVYADDTDDEDDEDAENSVVAPIPEKEVPGRLQQLFKIINELTPKGFTKDGEHKLHHIDRFFFPPQLMDSRYLKLTYKEKEVFYNQITFTVEAKNSEVPAMLDSRRQEISAWIGYIGQGEFDRRHMIEYIQNYINKDFKDENTVAGNQRCLALLKVEEAKLVRCVEALKSLDQHVKSLHQHAQIFSEVDILVEELNKLAKTEPQKEAMKTFHEDQFLAPTARKKGKHIEALLEEWLEFHALAGSKENKEIAKLKDLLNDVKKIQTMSSSDANKPLENARAALQKIPSLGIVAPVQQHENGKLVIVVNDNTAKQIVALRQAKALLDQTKKHPELAREYQKLQTGMASVLNPKWTDVDVGKLAATCETVESLIKYLQEAKQCIDKLSKFCEGQDKRSVFFKSKEQLQTDIGRYLQEDFRGKEQELQQLQERIRLQCEEVRKLPMPLSPAAVIGTFGHAHATAAGAAAVAPAEKKAEKLGLIRCYLDFDGTLTKCKGEDVCIKPNPLYASLQVTAKQYADTIFKSQDTMVDLLKIAFKAKPDHPMKVTNEALKFLQDMLALQAGAEIVIVSKNRKEYIKAVLLASGMELDYVDRIVIRDINDVIAAREKGKVLSQHENKADTPSAKVIVICDDNMADINSMFIAVHKLPSHLVDQQAETGQFNWADISDRATKAAALAAPRHTQAGGGGAAAGPSPSR